VVAPAGRQRASRKPPPQTDHAVGRKKHDHQKAEAYKGLKAAPVETDGDQSVERESAQDHVDDGADKSADRMAEAADDGSAEYAYRFAPLVGIYGGTLEVFRNMIGQYTLGLGKPNYSPPKAS